MYSVATPLLEECEDDTYTPEMGTWESSGILETSLGVPEQKAIRM
jgi:hypothetical protein